MKERNYIETAACGFLGISKFGKNIYLRRKFFQQMEPETIVVRCGFANLPFFRCKSEFLFLLKFLTKKYFWRNA